MTQISHSYKNKFPLLCRQNLEGVNHLSPSLIVVGFLFKCFEITISEKFTNFFFSVVYGKKYQVNIKEQPSTKHK